MARRTVDHAGLPRTIQEYFTSPWFYLLLAAALGAFVTMLVYGQVPPRWIKASIGLLFVLALFRLSIRAVLLLFLIAWPFPTFIYLGTTNTIFIFLMLVVWWIRVALRVEPLPPRTFLDWAGAMYIVAHLVSFLNATTAFDLQEGIRQVVFLGFALGLYYLVAKLLRKESDLISAYRVLSVTSLLVGIIAVSEYAFPHLKLLPKRFMAVGGGLMLGEGGHRLVGAFGSQILTADFGAIMFTMQLFLFIRAKNVFARIFYLLLMGMGIFQIVLAVNRMGFVIWVIGVLYVLWLGRGRGAAIARRMILLAPILLAAGGAIEKINKRYLETIALFQRFQGTQFEAILPDTRAMVWRHVMREIPQHLWIGHGPYYNLIGPGGGLERYWPHSAYLFYLWTTGVFGCAVFVWILAKTLYKSYPGGKLEIRDVPFAQGALLVGHVQVLQFAVAQILDEHQRGDVYPYLMWIVIGLAAASYRIRSEQKDAAARAGAGPPSARSGP